MNTYVWKLQNYDVGLCVICADSEEEALELLRSKCNRTNMYCDYCYAFDAIQGRIQFETKLTRDINSKYYIVDGRWGKNYGLLRKLLLEEFLEASKTKTIYYLKPELVKKPSVFVAIGSSE